VYGKVWRKDREEGSVDEILSNPQHPYTKALIDTIPGMEEKVDRFVQIPHNVPHPMNKPQGCYFSNRCAYCTDLCKTKHPPLFDRGNGRKIRCYYEVEELWEK
jgi:oligopeptide/dipeptide ABC transporter ATP-binding protein